MIKRQVIRNAAATLVAAVAMSGAAVAHANHKIMGTVTMVAADHIMVKDRAGKAHGHARHDDEGDPGQERP